jgi:hypothetical protein
MSQQSQLADHAHERLSATPVSASYLIRLVRDRLGEIATPVSVHFFVAESIRCLLRYEDVEVGDLVDDRFVAWSSDAIDSEQRIEDELSSFDTYLEDDGRYVFRKKNEPTLKFRSTLKFR